MRAMCMFGSISLMFIVVQAQEEVSIVASKDCGLYETTNGSLSNGIGPLLFVGKIGQTGDEKIRRALMKFNLDGKVPAGSTIVNAQLKIHVSKVKNTGVQGNDLIRVTSDWGEGTSNGGNNGQGGASTTNDATWMHRFFNTISWTNPGGDFVTEASSHIAVGDSSNYTFDSTSLLIKDIQGWLDNPSTNFGWIIIGNEAVAQSVKVIDSRESATESNRPTLIVQYTGPTSVEGRVKTPNQFSLEQNFPNPFNPTTVIRYSIPASSHVSLRVFDVLGKEIAVLVNETKETGSFSYEWETTGLTSGVYFYRLQSGSNTATKKLVLTK